MFPPMFEISVNIDILILGFYGYIENIDRYFDKNIGKVKIMKIFEKTLKKYKINE